MLRDMLESAGVDTHLTKEVGVPTGHAIIQVNEKGNNCIILFGGANQQITSAQIDATLAEFSAGDYLILQTKSICSPKSSTRHTQRDGDIPQSLAL